MQDQVSHSSISLIRGSSRNDTEGVRVLVSEPIPLDEFPVAGLLRRPMTEEQLREIEPLLTPDDTEVGEATESMESVNGPSETVPQPSRVRTLADVSNNCSSTTNCTGSDPDDDSDSISWIILLIILIVCVPLCFLFGCVGYRFISFRKSESKSESNIQTPVSTTRQVTTTRQILDQGPPPHQECSDRGFAGDVVRWLEDPVRHQPHDPVPLVPEDLNAYRLQMIQRAQAYGYNPLQHHPMHHLHLSGHGPDESPLSWQLYST